MSPRSGTHSVAGPGRQPRDAAEAAASPFQRARLETARVAEGLREADGAESQFQRARLLVGTLVRAGVRRAVTSPGSRSTPLVLAALDAAEAGVPAALDVVSIIDERAAGFFALGQARATGMPTALICTSGSAAAHYFPAILEAREAGLPLIVLSADRPAELMDCASPQTTDQTKLFGSAVNHFAEIDLGGRTDAPSLRALRRAAAQAVFRSRWPRGCAVHLNVRARKPLERPEGGARHPAALAVDELLEEPLDVGMPSVAPDPDALDRAAGLCRQTERGLIVAGPLPLPPHETRQAAGDVFRLAELARRTGFPLAAEAASQSRFVAPDSSGGAGPLAACLGAAWAADGGETLPAPDLVLQVGAPPVSAGLQRLLEASGAPRIIVSDGPWTDPAGLATVFLAGDVEAAVAGLCCRLEAAPADSTRDGWRRDVLALCSRFRELAAAVAGSEDGVSAHPAEPRRGNAPAPGARTCGSARRRKRPEEQPGRRSARLATFHDGHAVRAAVEATPTGGLLMLGNSLPVRLVEDWVGPIERRIWVGSQRGLSGIDGLVAGFLGCLSTGGLPAGVLLLGDVSLLHDLDGLTVASAYGEGPPAVIVVIDNGGGRIFDRLPIAATPVFQGPAGRHWLTPHGVDLAGLAPAFGLPCARVDALSGLEQELEAALGRSGVSLLVAGCAPGALDEAEVVLRRAMASPGCQLAP